MQILPHTRITLKAYWDTHPFSRFRRNLKNQYDNQIRAEETAKVLTGINMSQDELQELALRDAADNLEAGETNPANDSEEKDGDGESDAGSDAASRSDSGSYSGSYSGSGSEERPDLEDDPDYIKVGNKYIKVSQQDLIGLYLISLYSL